MDDIIFFHNDDHEFKVGKNALKEHRFKCKGCGSGHNNWEDKENCEFSHEKKARVR